MARSQGAGSSPAQKDYAGRFPGGVPLHGDQEMYKWVKVGQELVGEFVALKPFKNGHLAKVNTGEDIVTFSAPSVLASILEGVRPGTKVAIVFSGEKPSEQGGRSPTKLFQVFALKD